MPFIKKYLRSVFGSMCKYLLTFSGLGFKNNGTNIAWQYSLIFEKYHRSHKKSNTDLLSKVVCHFTGK